MNIKPAICDSHLAYPRGQCYREGRVGVLDAAGGCRWNKLLRREKGLNVSYLQVG